MAQGSAGVPSASPQRRDGPTILQVPIISQRGIWGHPFFSQPWPSHDGGDLHGAKGTVMGIYGIAQGHVWLGATIDFPCRFKQCLEPGNLGDGKAAPRWV